MTARSCPSRFTRRRRRISNSNNTARLNNHRQGLTLCRRLRSKRMVRLLLLGVGRVALIHHPLTLERLARVDTGLVQNANALTLIKSASPGGAE